MPSKDHLKAWDDEYRRQGRLWMGKQADVPQLKKGSDVLELGCGDGKTLLELARQDARIVGLDVSRAGLELASKALVRDEKQAMLLQADVTALPFADASFDAIIAFHVLDHIYEEDRQMAVEEIARVLAPGGKVHFRGFSRQDLRSNKGEVLEEGTVLRGNGIIYHYFTIPEVRELFKGLFAQDVRAKNWKMGGKRELERSFILGDFVKTSEGPLDEGTI